MSERALRGTRLVVTSYETDRGIDLAPRQAVEYACQNGHRFEMPFSVEAEIPPEWECKACGAQALLVDGDGPEEKKGKPARTRGRGGETKNRFARPAALVRTRPQGVRGGRGPWGSSSGPPDARGPSSRMTSPWTTFPSGRCIRACWNASPRLPGVAARIRRSSERSA